MLINDLPMKLQGLDMIIHDNGDLERVIVDDEKEYELPPMNLKEVIIDLSEMRHDGYIILLQTLEQMSKNIKGESKEDYAKAERFLRLVNDVCNAIEENDFVLAYLTKSLVEGTLFFYASEDLPTQIDCVIQNLNHILFISLELDYILTQMSKGENIDFENKCIHTRFCEVNQSFYRTNDGVQTGYRVQSVNEYYILLIHKFIELNPIVSRCQACNRFFIPKTKKKTLYCDRVLKTGKTCKETAPAIKHKLESMKDEVICVFDKEKNKMYKRLERTTDFNSNTEKLLNYSDYYAWLDKATEARNNYIQGNITKEQALKSIKVD